MADLTKVKRNVAKMKSMGAPQAHILGYLRQAGISPESLGESEQDTNQQVNLPSQDQQPISQGESQRNIPEAVIGQSQGTSQPSMSGGSQMSDPTVIQTPYGPMRAETLTPKSVTLKPIVSPEKEAQKKTLEQVSAQKGKDVLSTMQNTLSANLKQDVVKRVWLDMLDQENKETGWKPGVGLGMSVTLRGKMKWNDFYEAFEGTSNEYAAAVARIAMPNTRAIRAIQLFKAGKPTQFSTVESGVDNMMRTYENIITTDMSRSPESYLPGYRNTESDKKVLSAMVERFGELYKESFFKEVYGKNPDLLKKETINRYGLRSKEEHDPVGLR